MSDSLWPHGLIVAHQAPLSMELRIPDWVAISYSKESFQTQGDWVAFSYSKEIFQTQGSNPRSWISSAGRQSQTPSLLETKNRFGGEKKSSAATWW